MKHKDRYIFSLYKYIDDKKIRLYGYSRKGGHINTFVNHCALIGCGSSPVGLLRYNTAPSMYAFTVPLSG